MPETVVDTLVPRYFGLSLALAAALAVPGQARPADQPEVPQPAKASPATPPDVPFEMETFQLVLLVRAPTWKKLPDDQARALQAAHLEHLARMGTLGKAVICGPFEQQQDPAFRGACIYDVRTVEEARALAEEDPVVKAGQLRIEAMTWWVGKGYMTFPRRSPDPTR
jgi:uncharacterized protein YciI